MVFCFIVMEVSCNGMQCCFIVQDVSCDAMQATNVNFLLFASPKRHDISTHKKTAEQACSHLRQNVNHEPICDKRSVEASSTKTNLSKIVKENRHYQRKDVYVEVLHI
jgi:hypothetical protein